MIFNPTFQIPKNSLLNLVNEGDTEYLAFGTYYMEHCLETGSRTKDEIKKPLLWEVLRLSEDGNHALLLCKNIISFQPFDNNSYGTSWDTCTLRTWLNNEFYNVAFDSDERKLIEGSTITTPIFGTLESIETTDKIFVLSMEEAATLLGNGDVSSLDMIADWRVRTTYGDADDAYGWWLRSPTCDEGATYIGNNGRMTDYFINEMYDSMGVCPALWISLCDDVTDISPTSDVVISEYINIYKPKQKLTEKRIELIRENAVAAGISEFPGGRSLEQMLINEIYAMKGYIFNDKELYEYFMNKSWYIPTTNDMDIISDSLTETEKKNVEFLKARRTVKINDIKSISATSALKEKSVTHKAEYISDDDLTTCWCEGETGLGIGECVVWKFSAAQNIAGFTIYNGYLKSEGHYKKNAIPNMIAFEFYNKNGEFVGREEFTLADSMFDEAIKGTYYKFNKANDVCSVMMEILGANNGSKYEDTCISELTFWGYY